MKRLFIYALVLVSAGQLAFSQEQSTPDYTWQHVLPLRTVRGRGRSTASKPSPQCVWGGARVGVVGLPG